MSELKVAIYSGVVPSTTFIDRLVEGVAERGMVVLLFGTLNKPTKYRSSNVKVVGNRSGWSGVVQTIVRIIQLRILSPGKYRKLRQHIGAGPFTGSKAFRAWQRFGPVILYQPDIFHVQWAKAVGEWVFLKERFGVKLVVSLRGTHINYSPLADSELASMYRKVLPSYDAYHAVSDAIAQQGVNYGMIPEKIKTIYSGIKSLPLLDKKEFFANGTFRILVVGRMHWVKGYHYLLDAFRLVKEGGIHFSTLLIAEGSVPEEILFQRHDLELNDEVRWVNGLPHQQVLSEMTSHDVLVLPSVEEGIANVVLEAMNAGLPVISTECGGMNEVITEGVNGFLVPVRQPIAMAAALMKFRGLSNEALNLIRRQAHHTIQQKFNRDKAMELFSGMYRGLI